MQVADAPVLTIDGPGGSGKGTVSVRVARVLGWHYLDSGALYRVLGLVASRAEVSFDDSAALAALALDLDVSFPDGGAMRQGEDLEPLIRGEEAGERASLVARHEPVRTALMRWQRDCARMPGLVADGRDMGTVVFDDAICKIYLTASAEARAKRRFNQLRLKGFDVNIRRLFEEITERDQRDANRPVSPLRPARDATLIDSTDLTIDQVVEEVLELVATVVPGRVAGSRL